MRSTNSRLSWGTRGNPQTSIAQLTSIITAAKKEGTLKELLEKEPMIDENLVAELERQKVKFARKDMVFITRDKTGQIVWLEKGAEGAGLGHMQTRGHIEQMAKAFGICKDEVEAYLRKVINSGTVIKNELKPIGNRMGYERVYYYQGNYCVVTAVGTNGFIVSAYPRKYDGEP